MLHVCLQRGFKTGGQRAKNRQTEHRADAARHARRNDPTRMMPRRIHLESCLVLAQHSYTLSDTAVCSCAAQKHSSANEFRGRLHCAQHLQLERRHTPYTIHTEHHHAVRALEHPHHVCLATHRARPGRREPCLTSLPSPPDVVFASDGGVDEPAGAPEGLGGMPPPPPPLRAAILSAMLEPPPLFEGPFQRTGMGTMVRWRFKVSFRAPTKEYGG